MSTETTWIKDLLPKKDSIDLTGFTAEEIMRAFMASGIEISIEEKEVQEVFTEDGKKIHSLLESNNVAEVEQGLVLLETPYVLDKCFVDTSTEHSFFDFFELTVDKYCLFKELYDALFVANSRYTHRMSILEFIVQHAPPTLTWAQDLDAYLRIPWNDEDTWPERKALSKTRLQTLDGDIDRAFINDLVRIKANVDGTFVLITNDFQQISCSAEVLGRIGQQFTEHKRLLEQLRSLPTSVPDESLYPLSLVLRDIAPIHSDRSFLQGLVPIYGSYYKKWHWVRESAVSNPMFSLNELTAMIELEDRYILKGIVQNPNCSDELRARVNTLLEDEETYPVVFHQYTLSSNTGTYGETAYMGLDELVSYCLKVHQDDAEYFLMNFELPEGVAVDQGQYFMDNLQQMAWRETRTRLGSFENCPEVETSRTANNGWLLLESMVKSDCEYEDELQGTVYFELDLEYPLAPNKITWHTDIRGKWGLEYDGVIHRGQSGSPDYQGGYATALKIFLDGEWKELPSIIGTSWYYDFLLKGCDVDKSSETAHADMKAWLLEKHPDLKQAITSIHPTEASPEQ